MAKNYSIESLTSEFARTMQVLVGNDQFMHDLGAFAENEDNVMWIALKASFKAWDNAELTEGEQERIEQIKGEMIDLENEETTLIAEVVQGIAEKITAIDWKDPIKASKAMFALQTDQNSEIDEATEVTREEMADLSVERQELHGKKRNAFKSTFANGMGHKTFGSDEDPTELPGSRKIAGVLVCDAKKTVATPIEALYRVETNSYQVRSTKDGKFAQIGNIEIKNRTQYQRMHTNLMNMVEAGLTVEKAFEWAKAGENADKKPETWQKNCDGDKKVYNVVAFVENRQKELDVASVLKIGSEDEGTMEILTEWAENSQ